MPPGSTSITREQMAMLVNFVLREHGLPHMTSDNTTAEVRSSPRRQSPGG